MRDLDPFPLRLREISLISRQSGRESRARIWPLTKRTSRKLIQSQWWRETSRDLTRASREADHSWDWAAYAGQVEEARDVGELVYGYTLLTCSGRTLAVQGAVIYSLDARSFRSPGRLAAYLRFVASAPRNRRHLMGDQAEYRDVGKTLTKLVMLHSLQLGRGGRVACQPVSGAESFYEDLGFQIVVDPVGRGAYYEIDEEASLRLVTQMGWWP